MGVSLLPSTQALNPGADLWVIGSPSEDGWALRVDWHLNFQVLRSSRHRTPTPSTELLKVLEQTGLSWQETKAPSAPLMVPGDLNLPCRWVISLTPWHKETVAHAWRELGQPTVRVFLPESESIEKFEDEWLNGAGPADCQLVAPEGRA